MLHTRLSVWSIFILDYSRGSGGGYGGGSLGGGGRKG